MSTAVVVGGASGIGRAVSERLHQRGDTVVIVDRDAKSGRVVVDGLGDRAHFVASDMGEETGPATAIETALDATGGDIDTLYYGPAVLESRPLSDWTVDEWDRSLAVNLRGAFFTVQAAESALRQSPRGRVILMSSTGAFRGHAGMPAYHASKTGMLGLVRALADELAPDVTVNAVCPGWIDTPFNEPYWSFQNDAAAARRTLEAGIPAGRQGNPEDVSGIVEFLASSESSYITGQSFTVDGGYTAV